MRLVDKVQRLSSKNQWFLRSQKFVKTIINDHNVVNEGFRRLMKISGHRPSSKDRKQKVEDEIKG